MTPKPSDPTTTPAATDATAAGPSAWMSLVLALAGGAAVEKFYGVGACDALGSAKAVALTLVAAFVVHLLRVVVLTPEAVKRMSTGTRVGVGYALPVILTAGYFAYHYPAGVGSRASAGPPRTPSAAHGPAALPPHSVTYTEAPEPIVQGGSPSAALAALAAGDASAAKTQARITVENSIGRQLDSARHAANK